jgi:hypothetical protein
MKILDKIVHGELQSLSILSRHTNYVLNDTLSRLPILETLDPPFLCVSFE